MPITFEGKFSRKTCIVTKNGKPLLLHLAKWTHSPSGFSWGYYGSGPTQLALCMLYEMGKDSELVDPTDFAETYAQKFKGDFIARIPMEKNWIITGEDITQWLMSQYSEKPAMLDTDPVCFYKIK